VESVEKYLTSLVSAKNLLSAAQLNELQLTLSRDIKGFPIIELHNVKYKGGLKPNIKSWNNKTSPSSSSSSSSKDEAKQQRNSNQRPKKAKAKKHSDKRSDDKIISTSDVKEAKTTITPDYKLSQTPEQLIIKIQLPNTQSTEDLNLDINNNSIRLTSKLIHNQCYELDISPLSAEINSLASVAKFNSKLSQLIITAPTLQRSLATQEISKESAANESLHSVDSSPLSILKLPARRSSVSDKHVRFNLQQSEAEQDKETEFSGFSTTPDPQNPLCYKENCMFPPYNYSQSKASIAIVFKVNHIHPESVQLNYLSSTELTVQFTAEQYKGKKSISYYCYLPLSHPINQEKCNYAVHKKNLVLNLIKSQQKDWKKLLQSDESIEEEIDEAAVYAAQSIEIAELAGSAKCNSNDRKRLVSTVLLSLGSSLSVKNSGLFELD
jgi:HSP20 family molecular chaperone IbpA